jgi:hypothetical protein
MENGKMERTILVAKGEEAGRLLNYFVAYKNIIKPQKARKAKLEFQAISEVLQAPEISRR